MIFGGGYLIYIEPMFYRKELEFDIYSAVVTHGHSGQLPGCPRTYEPHVNLCILWLAVGK
jgi:hypothetical protein